MGGGISLDCIDACAIYRRGRDEASHQTGDILIARRFEGQVYPVM